MFVHCRSSSFVEFSHVCMDCTCVPAGLLVFTKKNCLKEMNISKKHDHFDIFVSNFDEMAIKETNFESLKAKIGRKWKKKVLFV